MRMVQTNRAQVFANKGKNIQELKINRIIRYSRYENASPALTLDKKCIVISQVGVKDYKPQAGYFELEWKHFL